MSGTTTTYAPTFQFPGDFIVTAGNDPSNGTGIVRSADFITTSSTSNATNTSTGAVRIPLGGLSVGQDIWGAGQLTVLLGSFLQQTSVTTNNGPFTVQGSGQVNVTSSASSITLQTLGLQSINFLAGSGLNQTLSAGDLVNTVSSGNMTSNVSGNVNFILTGAGNFVARSTKGQVILTGGNGTGSAVTINTGDPASGIMLSAGTTGLTANSTGPIFLTANNAASGFNLITSANQQDLTFQLSGATASRIVLNSSGTGFDAINLVSSAGGINQNAVTKLNQNVSNGPFILAGNASSSSITQNMTADGQNLSIQLLSPSASTGYNGTLSLQSNGNGTSAFTLSAPNGGFNSSNMKGHILTSSNGPFNLISGGGTTSCRIASAVTSDSQDFTIALTDATQSKQSRLFLSSQCPPADALRLAALVGGVTAAAVTNFTAVTSAGPFALSGTIPSTTTTGGCSLTEYSSASGQDFAIGLLGTGSGPGTSRLTLTSAGTGLDALYFNSTVGGITMKAAAQISLDTMDTTNGIRIGTLNSSVPIFLGKTGNQVTCASDITFTGNLTFATNTTIPVETQQLLVQDRSIVINSNTAFSGDSALLLQRYQSTPNGISDDVVTDTPYVSGTAQSGTSNTIVLASTSSTTNNFYVGFYIKITAGTGRNFVSQITAYNGSTTTATIKDTFTTAPDSTSVYSLYGNTFAGVAYRNIAKRFELLYCPTNYETSSTQITPTAYAPLYLQSLQTVPGTGTIQTDSIAGSSGTAINVSGVTANNGTLSNVSTINGDTPSSIVTVALTVANGTSTTVSLSMLSASMTGSYMLIINADQNTNPGGPTEMWFVSKASTTRNGACTKVNSQNGSTKNETLRVTWPSSASATLTYDTTVIGNVVGANNLPASGTYKFIVKLVKTLTSV